MLIKIRNLSLVYPLRSLDHYLLRAKIVHSFKNFFKKQKTDESLIKKKNHIVALDGINFNLESNDRVGLIGLNGSGKSTLLSTLAGIYTPSSGYIDIDYKSSIPIIQPYSVCENDDTVKNNIIVIALLLGFKKKQIMKQMNEILEFSELVDYQNLPVATLSQGMKFKMVFGVCFVLDGKKVYFIDEFFTTGDEKFQNRGFDYINQKKDCIIMVCSHSRRIIQNFCNKVLILDKGKQVFFGNIDEGLDLYNDIIKK